MQKDRPDNQAVLSSYPSATGEKYRCKISAAKSLLAAPSKGKGAPSKKGSASLSAGNKGATMPPISSKITRAAAWSQGRSRLDRYSCSLPAATWQRAREAQPIDRVARTSRLILSRPASVRRIRLRRVPMLISRMQAESGCAGGCASGRPFKLAPCPEMP